MRNNNKLITTLFAFFSALSSSIADAATFLVDRTGAADFTTIQAAVDHVASIESTGSRRGYAYFTKGSDLVYIEGGIESLQPGMLISVDDRNWYRIGSIVDFQYVRITRTFTEDNRFNNYKAVEENVIKLTPGIYAEKVDLQNVHFVKFLGWRKANREAVTVQSPDPFPEEDNAPPFRNIQLYGAITFENLTIRNVSDGAILTTYGEGATVTAPSDMNLTLRNVHFDAQCCDVVYSPYGHVVIEDSRLEGENDVLLGYFKSLMVKRSDIMTLREITKIGVNKAIAVQLNNDSIIEESLIAAKTRDSANPAAPNSSGVAIRVDATNGATLTIRNSIAVVDGGIEGTALDLMTGGGTMGSSVIIEGSKLLSRSRGTSTDLRIRTVDDVTLKCTEYATVTGGGTPVVQPCP